MSDKSHSGFAQFPDIGNREQFVRKVLTENQALTEHAYLSGSRPTIVFENLNDNQHAQIVSALEGLGRWFEDVQFESTE